MTDLDLNLENAGTRGHIKVNGQELHDVREVTIKAKAGHVPEVLLSMDAIGLRARIDGTIVKVEPTTLEVLHGAYHDEPTRMYGPIDCSVQGCPFWEVAKFLVDELELT